MVTLSVIIITKNEEDNIWRCLESVKWANELIVVDSFSTDKTIEIAKQYTDKIYLNDNTKCLNINKNLGMEKATGEWILIMDADEIVPPELTIEIKEILKRNTKAFDGYLVMRKNMFLGKWMKHGGWWEYAQNIELVRKGRGYFPPGLHDALKVPSGKVGRLNNPIIHHNIDADTSEWIDKMNFYTNLETEEMKEAGTKFSMIRTMILPFVVFFISYIWKSGYRDGFHGLVAATFAAFYVFIKNVKLWELQR